MVDRIKFERAFGANPTPLAEGVRQMVSWYRKHIVGPKAVLAAQG